MGCRWTLGVEGVSMTAGHANVPPEIIDFASVELIDGHPEHAPSSR
jgi:hypothetical protein